MNKSEILKRNGLIIFLVVIAVVSIVVAREKRLRKNEEKKKEEIVEKKEGYDNTGDYNVDLIKKFHEVDNNKNYLISPYNIEIALNMLRDGADGNTKAELDKVLGSRVINDVKVKDKVGIANGVFIREKYKNDVKSNYYQILNDKYKSEIIYDEFTTPDKINNWVKDKTNGMIEKILDEMNSDFVMGLASALAIDVKWLDEFECTSTNSEEFTKINNEKINVQMMHNTYKNMSYKYFKNDDSEGIIIPYQKEEDSNVELEFIGILPTGSVDSFVKGLTKDKLINIDKNVRVANEDLNINVSLPRFKYDYEPNDFISILKGIGIKEAFDPDNANFKNMIEIKENVYVGEAIHKTHIELNEKGTKAAAITYFGMFKNSAMLPGDPEIINIKFNKPFVYMIREKNTKEILFFGSVYEPNTWNGSTCENEKGK